MCESRSRGQDVRTIDYALLAALLAVPSQSSAAGPSFSPRSFTPTPMLIAPAQLFALAEKARTRGDARTAEKAYRALASNPDLQVRSEARFRLGRMFWAMGRRVDAAILFRQILDEQPKTQRVRLELARVLDDMGDESGARRALREVQAGGLPPDVVRFVDRYSAALRAKKPFGATFEAAVAPDSNINRATRSDTLGTVIGDFILDDEAKQKSGVGAALRGQVYARIQLGDTVNLLGRASGSADLYRESDFNDLAIELSAGPELRLGRDRLAAEASQSLRWFGGKLLLRSTTLGLTYLHPLGQRSQLRFSGTAGMINHRFNRLQSGRSYSASLAYERALSATTGIGASLALGRQALRDPGYATSSGQLAAFAYHELGAMTLVGSLSAGRLKADERLFLYPERRSDWLYRASLGATMRRFEMGRLAPFVRLTRETNKSSIEIFDYQRTRTEIGVTRAF